MKTKPFGTWAAAIALFGAMLPPSALAAPPIAGTNDIALRPGGLLVGQVVDPQGIVRAGMPVSIEYAGHEVVRTTTDESGVFAAKGLREGQYQLNTVEGSSSCHLWAADKAPPTARPEALVVSGNNNYLVRGQTHSSRGLKGWIWEHPYLTAGTIAAAVAIPLVLADDDWDH